MCRVEVLAEKSVRDKRRNEAGLSLVEVLLSLSVVVLIIAIAVFIYKQRIEPTLWANSKYNLINSVMSAIENAKASRGGVYPAYNGALTNTNSPLYPYLASKNTAPDDLVGATYTCNAGTNQNLTITFPFTDTENPRGKAQLVDKLQRANFTVNTNATALSVVLQGVNCN